MAPWLECEIGPGGGSRRRLPVRLTVAAAIALAGVTAMLLATSAAQAARISTRTLPDGVQRATYSIGPINATPGQNRIAFRPISGPERPSVDGWITRIKPNLVKPNGKVPLSSRVMFHHGVWLNLSRRDATMNSFERFYATGEEKTIMDLPDGYGYRYKASDAWILNDMIHVLIPKAMKLYATYTIDFIPDSSPAAAGIKPVRPIWMDVQNGSIYPVFDVHRGSGGKDGKFTYPTDEQESPYPAGVQKNEWTVDEDGVLLATTGHVHSGGLSTDLFLRRDGATYQGPRCGKKKRKRMSKRRKRQLRKCAKSKPRVRGDRVHLFKSKAHYFEPRGPVSWDVAMVSTKPGWRVAVKAGDTLELTTTYETRRASWYESMGINVVYMASAEDAKGRNPFKKKVDWHGVVNHGHYAENNDHGGKKPRVGPDPGKLPNGIASDGPFDISGFTYGAGDFRLPGAAGRPPTVKEGQSFTFVLSEADASQEIWHSLTSCKSPCNKSTGIAYPIADGKFQFDSGQLGDITPAVGTREWKTPSDLPPGTYTFFCRIHPLMRGAFRVVDPNGKKKPRKSKRKRQRRLKA